MTPRVSHHTRKAAELVRFGYSVRIRPIRGRWRRTRSGAAGAARPRAPYALHTIGYAPGERMTEGAVGRRAGNCIGVYPSPAPGAFRPPSPRCRTDGTAAHRHPAGP